MSGEANDEGADEDVEAAHPFKDAFGVRGEEVPCPWIWIENKKERGKWDKPHCELLPCWYCFLKVKKCKEHYGKSAGSIEQRISNLI